MATHAFNRQNEDLQVALITGGNTLVEYY